MSQNWIYQTESLSYDFKPTEFQKYFTYIIINNITGQSYIGMKSTKGSWKDYYGSCKDLTADIKKLSKDSFTRIIERFFDNKEDVAIREVDLQISFNVLWATFEDGSRMFYNRAISGAKFNMLGRQPSGTGQPGTFLGKKHTKEAIELMTEARKKHSGPNKGKIGTFTGKIHSTETRQLMHDSAIGKVKSPEHRAALSAAGKGKTAHNKGKPRTELEIQNMKAGMARSRNQKEFFLIYLTALQAYLKPNMLTDLEFLFKYENMSVQQKRQFNKDNKL